MTSSHPNRRLALRIILACGLGLLASPLHAAAPGRAETVKGLKAALSRGAAAAVDRLGRPDGFLANERVRIPLPAKVQRVEKMLRRFGGGGYADQLVETMNRAAETAVVEAKPILWQAVRQMSVDDASGILRGGDDAATQYFRRTTTPQLTTRLRPLVEAATEKVGVTRKYEKFARSASQFGLLDAGDADLDTYITEKALNGLFLMIAEEEKAIRQDPVATGSALLKKVFGSLLD